MVIVAIIEVITAKEASPIMTTTIATDSFSMMVKIITALTVNVG
jgi:hypothetical protein